MEVKTKLTPEQESAVEYRGGTLLVSAAAGSGKTKVLVERLISRVEDEDDIDEFLVITYTRAAAAELREKIYDEILKRLATEPNNRRLRRQSLLCRGASIDTIHGFCTDILRENGHLADLPPDFRVADESESEVIKAEVLEDVLNNLYESIDASSGFKELIDTISAGRDDRKIVGIILETHARLRSNPNPRAWVMQQKENLSLTGVSDVSQTAWGMYLMEKARRNVAFWLGEMSGTREVIRDLPDMNRAYGECFEATISDIEMLQTALCNSWDEARRYSAIDFSRVKVKRIAGYDDIKDIRSRCRAAMKKNAAIFEYTSNEHLEDMLAVARPMSALLDLILDFDGAYLKEKRRRGVVDFSDLEHLALSILTDSDTGEKTSLALAVSQRFKEILVDEYQDVNAVQEMIFRAVSHDGNNIFMVGDVKQSIYRFRLADPSIFLEKYRSFEDAHNKTQGIVHDVKSEDGAGGAYGAGSAYGAGGAKILLSRNFRSRAGILGAVNYLFGNIMSAELGEMDYTDRERLIPREGEGADLSDSAVELDIIDISSLEENEDEESPAKTQIEASYIAKRITELTNGQHTIPDGNGGDRCIMYSDIVILLRSIKDKAWQYAAALTEQEIPVDMPGGEGFFETAEISAALSILTVIDNPMQDIPLAAALCSPAYGFTPDELATIRAESQTTDYYSALVSAAGKADSDDNKDFSASDALYEKCAFFLEEIEAMRMIMPDMPADRFIWHMYNKTGLPGYIGAMRGGDRRRANLIQLAEYARIYEQNGYKGLFSFLTYVRMLCERGAEFRQDSAIPATGAAADNAVRIMSIHKSKGLEFPVVFLADTTKQFNNTDAQKSLVMHPELGLGPKRTDSERRIEYTTLARMAVQSKLTSEMLAEEMRVLYVAMTRAREKLIITATYKNAENEIEKLSKLKTSPQTLEDIKCVAGWILLPLLSGKQIPNQAESGGDRELIIESPEAWKVRLVPASGFIDQSETGERTFAHNTREPAMGSYSADVNPEDVETLRKRFGFAYPYESALELPSKMTVTGLAKQVGGVTDGDRYCEAWGQVPCFPRGESTVPVPMLHSTCTPALSAAERGTALHQAMQYIDYGNCGNEDSVRDELMRLREKGFLTKEQLDVIDALKITRFFESEIGKRVQKADTVKREFKFSLLYPAEHFYPGGGSDKILMQGVIDCFIEEDNELTVIDFKTDQVTTDSFEERARHYEPQLAAYSDALERMTGKRVKERLIYFLAIDRAYNCPTEYL